MNTNVYLSPENFDIINIYLTFLNDHLSILQFIIKLFHNIPNLP